MRFHLADYQQDVKSKAYQAWRDGARVVMPVMPTGSGKTVLMGNVAHEYPGKGVAVAHRSELVSQISIALAREELRHDIIAPPKTIKAIVAAQIEECGRSYYSPRADWKIASVDTLIRRDFPDSWVKQVGCGFQDEGHHVLQDNKWGRAMGVFPNAYWMLPTATPTRADRKGLGSHASGLVDALVEGPNMRWMIQNGHLTGYKLLMVKPSDLDMTGVAITDSGEYNQVETRKRVKASKIVGDVVKTYITHCRGMLGITFAVDIEHAEDIAKEYNKHGVPAVVVHADTPDEDRIKYMRMFKNRELLQLVNVDLFGEGVDVPAVEVVSMARPTASYGLYVQQFGRALRLLISPILRSMWHQYTSEQRLQFIAESAKPVAYIIDHVNNIINHGGPPDWRTEPWSLDDEFRSREAKDKIRLRACINDMCLQGYEAYLPACPYCGTEPPPPATRSKPEHVDGDIVLYTQEMLEELFSAIRKVDGPAYIPLGAAPIVANSIKKNHRERQQEQEELRRIMQLVMPPSQDERINDRRFFHRYGIDRLSAQALGSREAAELRQRIEQSIITQGK